MASLLLVGTSVVDVAVTQLRNALVGLGHTVTLSADSALGAVSVSAYDVIVTTRLTSALVATNGPIIRGWIQAGKPVLFGLSDQGHVDGATPTFVATQAGLMGTGLVDAPGGGVGDHNDAVALVNNTHSITTGIPLGELVVKTGPEWGYAVGTGQPFVGTRLGNGEAVSNRIAGLPVLVAASEGEAYLTGGGVLNARVVLAGFLYLSGANSFLADGLALLSRCITWLAASNTPPSTPTLVAAATQRSVVLTGSTFSDLNVSQTHAASRWQLTFATDTGFASPHYDSGVAGEAALTAKTLGCLPAGTEFLARVQYQDSLGAWSAWSVAVAFETLAMQEPVRTAPTSSLWS